MKTCPTCGHENAGDARFCSQCATPFEAAAPVREERKVVTVLFCDLAGFTARAERLDPEEVRAVLQPYHAHLRSELERFGGTVEKFIGDAVMAVFGAPVAHEDDPERAVRAALAIRETLTEEGLDLRIGVTTGEALITLGAQPEAGEGMAAGDVVNTAARLQAGAPTNAVLVDETTYRATDRAIEYERAEPVAAKGKAEPVAAWEALAARARVGVEPLGGAPLVGRERELELLRSTLARVADERSAQLVTLVGVPGIGKSRLVFELFRAIETGSFGLVHWRHGRSLPYGEGVTFWALSEMVKAQAGILESDGAEEARAKLRTAVAAAVRDPSETDWVERHLRPLAGLETDEAWTGDRRTEAFAAWRRFLEALAEERLLTLVFEDLHWADDQLLDFVDHLVEWAGGVPLLVICTARPELLERRPGWGGGKANAATLQLSPLSDDQTSVLVHSLLGRAAIGAELQARLLERAGGNPLYAEEFVRMVTERPADAVLPETVQGIVAARLDTLSPGEKDLLQQAAVVGRTFWLGALGGERSALEERLHALERTEFVRRERRSSVDGESEYAFRHALVHEVAYEQIPKARRPAMHLAAAEWIESLGRSEDHAEMLAHHYLAAVELGARAGRANDALGERARIAAREAGDRALALNAFPAAAGFYARALELSGGEDPGRPELLFRLGSALQLTDEERAVPVLEEASRELLAAGRSERAAEAQSLLSVIAWHRGDRDRSRDELGRAQSLLGAADSEGRANVLARVARARMVAGDQEEAIRVSLEALRIAERLDLQRVRAHALSTLGTSRMNTGVATGAADLERGIEIALAANNPEASRAYNNLAYHAFLVGDLRRGEELVERSIALAERFGNESDVRFGQRLRPEYDVYFGRWDDALARTDAFIAEYESGTPHYLEATAWWPRALVELARGHADRARAAAARAEDTARERADLQVLLPALSARLQVEAEVGDVGQAARLAAELLRAPPQHAIVPPAVELAWTARQLGTEGAVRAWIDAIRIESLWTDAALAILDGGHARAAEVFAQIGSLVDEARARLRAGDAENVAVALAFYRSVGATRYVREAEALLADAGLDVSA